ncbi:unnamed protein product [Closterium sp. NIES-54]
MAAAKRVLHYLCSTSGLGLVLGGRRPVVLTGHADASWADDQTTQRSSQGYTFSLGSGSVSWRSTRSSSVLGSSCEAEIYAGAMAAQELRWLTYLLTDLGEQPRSPPVLYVDNKAMLALCREHRLEHRTKHVALRYFLARELQQRGQLRLAYVASQANTADIFTKVLPLGDHQRFCTMLGFPTCTQLIASSIIPVSSHLVPTRLICDSKDGLSLFDLTSGTSTAPTADADSTVRSQWLTRDAAARLAVRNHLPSTERAHFSQYKSARALYDAVVARYSSPTTAALSRLMLPYLFPDLAAFATVADLVAHLRTSDARYRAALPTEFLPTNSPPMYITLYYLAARVVEAAAAVVEVAEEVALVAVQPRSVEALVVASVSSSCAPVRPCLFSSFTFTLPASPQQNGIAERRIGMVMDVARTSMIHAAAPHYLWLFAVQYAAHQINLQPRVSLPETTPTLRWMGKVVDASAFRLWGSRDFVRDTSADKLSSRVVPCVFLGFPPDAPGWQFYHPTSRRVLSYQDVTFEESGPAPSGVSQVDPAEPVEVAVDSGAARGAEPAGAGTGGAGPRGAEHERVESGGAEPAGAGTGGAEPGGAEPERVEPGGAEPGGTAS